MKLDTWVFHPTFGAAQIWFLRPDGSAVIRDVNDVYLDCWVQELRSVLPRNETASLKQLDYIQDVYGDVGCVLYVDETGLNPPLLTVRYPDGLRVRSWVEISAVVGGPF